MITRERELMGYFVHTNVDVYQRKWGNATVASEVSKWNWPAFLFTPIWLAYRKMYVPSLIIFSIGFLLSMIEVVTGFTLFYLMFPFFIYVGIQGNKMYFDFTKRKVQEIGDRPEVLMQVGGTSGGKAFVITFAYWIVGVAIGMMILFM